MTRKLAAPFAGPSDKFPPSTIKAHGIVPMDTISAALKNGLQSPELKQRLFFRKGTMPTITPASIAITGGVNMRDKVIF